MKKIKILHSNDIHADFFADTKSEAGILELEATVNSFRDENTLYLISGDVLNGSIIDQEYKGISTFELLNMLKPDLMCLGNHEFDYGSTWPLLLEKVADFPIICSNVYIRGTNKRLFKPYELIKRNGLNIAIIGLLTSETSTKLKQLEDDPFIEVRENYHDEVHKIIDELTSIDIDLTICLTHLGYKEDYKLAQKLNSNSGVDIIIGGHSHTFLQEPTECNGILIVQAGTSADNLGCFELEIDESKNIISSYAWSMLDTSKHKSSNQSLEKKLLDFKREIENKYSRVLTILEEPLEHKNRTIETTAGLFIADLLTNDYESSVAFVHGGFTRKEFIENKITLRTVHETWPFTDSLYSVKISAQTLEELLVKNSSNLGTQYFCCTSSNIQISILDEVKADIKVNYRQRLSSKRKSSL